MKLDSVGFRSTSDSTNDRRKKLRQGNVGQIFTSRLGASSVITSFGRFFQKDIHEGIVSLTIAISG